MPPIITGGPGEPLSREASELVEIPGGAVLVNGGAIHSPAALGDAQDLSLQPSGLQLKE